MSQKGEGLPERFLNLSSVLGSAKPPDEDGEGEKNVITEKPFDVYAIPSNPSTSTAAVIIKCILTMLSYRELLRNIKHIRISHTTLTDECSTNQDAFVYDRGCDQIGFLQKLEWWLTLYFLLSYFQ